jgi:hypothetical protein
MDFNDAGPGRVKALVVAGLVLLAMALGYSVGVQGASTSREIRRAKSAQPQDDQTIQIELARAIDN